MKILKKISVVLALLFVAVLPISITKVKKAEAAFTTTATGYTKASDVNYQKISNKVINWGARGEDCIFLSTYAQNFYTGTNTYDSLSKLSGGSSQSNAYNSVLYTTLKNFMTSKHTYRNSYSENNTLLRYTDCVSNGSRISSFYSGKEIGPAWDSGDTWNKEHTWPDSKGLGGQDEDDVMMIRPTWVQENSSRGNTAYGQSSGYYDPNREGANVRGDCARIVLYVYVRWGNTSNMWGKSGVMESMDVLLQWMEEDPVDTWEMGRNDAVQSITGTRNVFVDYPEYAWLLFGKTAPDDMPTPSGKASNGEAIGNAGSGSSGGNTGDNSGSGGDVTDTPTYSTPAEILNALYALSDGQTINGSFTLTGKITAIDGYKNPTFVVSGFESKPVYCYKLVLDNAKVGDVITVTATTLKNFQGKYEFMNCTLVSIQSGGNSGSNDSSGNTNSGDNSGNAGNETVAGSLAKFEFGANGNANHVDGNNLSKVEYTENGYTLSLTGGTQLYSSAFDAKGNSCIKIGSSKNSGGFSFVVADDVDQVKFEIAKYKDYSSKVKINGVEYTPSKNSDDGEYEIITIDTTSTKTVEVATLSGGYRVMINSIEFISLEESGNGNSGNTQPDNDGSGNTSIPDDSSVNSGTTSGDNTSSGDNSTAVGCESSISIGGAMIGLAVLVGSGIAIKKGKKED